MGPCCGADWHQEVPICCPRTPVGLFCIPTLHQHATTCTPGVCPLKASLCGTQESKAPFAKGERPPWLAAPLLASTSSVITHVLLPEQTPTAPHAGRSPPLLPQKHSCPVCQPASSEERGAEQRAEACPAINPAGCVCTGLAMATPLRLTAPGGTRSLGSRRPPGAPLRATVGRGGEGGSATVRGERPLTAGASPPRAAGKVRVRRPPPHSLPPLTCSPAR